MTRVGIVFTAESTISGFGLLINAGIGSKFRGRIMEPDEPKLRSPTKFRENEGGRAMKCEYCGKGRPRLWTIEGKFCDQTCREKAWDRALVNAVKEYKKAGYGPSAPAGEFMVKVFEDWKNSLPRQGRKKVAERQRR